MNESHVAQVAALERECFSTLDIIYADFKSNNISVIKAGASPTYVVTDQGIKKYECNSLPVGILKDIQIQKVLGESVFPFQRQALLPFLPRKGIPYRP